MTNNSTNNSPIPALNLSPIDRLLSKIDNTLKRATQKKERVSRATPSENHKQAAPAPLTSSEKQLVGGLMRINHTGEVCAQALYKGQALTAKSDKTRNSLLEAADEELDHLEWCAHRLNQLEEKTSRLNPIFYGLSFTLGAVTGTMGDKVSLGFVAETEKQVGKHLTEHLNRIPYKDKASRSILEQMRIDEAKHGAKAIEQGGEPLPLPVKIAMRGMARLMKITTFRV